MGESSDTKDVKLADVLQYTSVLERAMTIDFASDATWNVQTVTL